MSSKLMPLVSISVVLMGRPPVGSDTLSGDPDRMSEPTRRQCRGEAASEPPSGSEGSALPVDGSVHDHPGLLGDHEVEVVEVEEVG